MSSAAEFNTALTANEFSNEPNQEHNEDPAQHCSLCASFSEASSFESHCCVGCAEGWMCKGQVSLRYGDPGAEKLSAELEQRAIAEADALVSADGSICAERLALLRSTFDPQFLQRVLSRTAFAAQVELHRSQWNADSLNTALLLEDYREIRQWQTAAPSLLSVFPFRLHSLFEQKAAFDYKRLVPREFLNAHPSIRPKDGGMGEYPLEGKIPSRTQFRSLLNSFSCGILEGLPLHPDRLILSGSSMPWCLRRLTAEELKLCEAEAEATSTEAKLREFLRNKVGAAPATLIMWMAVAAVGDGQHSKTHLKHKERWQSQYLRPPRGTGNIRAAIRDAFMNEAWEDADIDLFVVGESAEATIQETVAKLQWNIDCVTGFRGSIVLRTKNTLTVAGGWPLPNVQIVCKTVRSAQELLVHSDIDCTAMAYDGQRVWAATRALRALATGFNFIPKQVLEGKGINSGRSQVRFSKYLKRGFGLLVFEHCRHLPRCDYIVPPNALRNLMTKKIPKEPRQVRGSPAEKGKALAEWMIMRSPDLRRKAARKEIGPVADDTGSSVGNGNILAHRHVPGDRDIRLQAVLPNSKYGGLRDGPMSSYFQFVDLIIPRSSGICLDTVREYVHSLNRPDLLQEALASDVTIDQKKSSDRQSWQDRARGKCYMCKVAMKSRDQWPVCVDCTAFNKKKRGEKMHLTGSVALVTGGRTKIGWECALRMLRAGATVVVTSRFPRCTAARYAEEDDFPVFRDRLHVFGADFRRLQSVQQVVGIVLQNFQKIDILIHNAAQTIRRPPAYYETLVRREEELSSLTDRDAECEKDIAEACTDATFMNEALALLPVDSMVGLPILSSDLEAEARKAEWFPPGLTDAHGEQLDLRTVTSWTQKLEDTEMPELVEVLAVNLVVPYLLTARWLPLLKKSQAAFVIFVTSQEGSFTTPTGVKNNTHPHTNVAKAGLNMLAKTIAGDLRPSSIFVSAVDPGWVSWMKPGGSQAVETAPLTEADGAARVLDPIISGRRAISSNRCPPVGVLFKDFRVTAW